MGRLAFLADEHVDRAYVSAIRSNGFRVAWVDDDSYEAGSDDEELLQTASRAGFVTLTSDDDFARLGETIEHSGIVLYQQYGHSLRSIVRAITRIDRYLDHAAFRNHVEWLENWL